MPTCKYMYMQLIILYDVGCPNYETIMREISNNNNKTCNAHVSTQQWKSCSVCVIFFFLLSDDYVMEQIF